MSKLFERSIRLRCMHLLPACSMLKLVPSSRLGDAAAMCSVLVLNKCRAPMHHLEVTRFHACKSPPNRARLHERGTRDAYRLPGGVPGTMEHSNIKCIPIFVRGNVCTRPSNICRRFVWISHTEQNRSLFGFDRHVDPRITLRRPLLAFSCLAVLACPFHLRICHDCWRCSLHGRQRPHRYV